MKNKLLRSYKDFYEKHRNIFKREDEYKYCANFLDYLIEKISFRVKSSEQLKSLKILEYGCRTGFNLQYLYESGFDNLHGIDKDPAMINEAKKLSDKSITFANSDFAKGRPDFSQKDFDVIFCRSVLYTKPDTLSESDIIKILDKFSSLLKNNGCFIAMEGSPTRDWKTFFEKNTNFHIIDQSVDNVFYLSKEKKIESGNRYIITRDKKGKSKTDTYPQNDKSCKVIATYFGPRRYSSYHGKGDGAINLLDRIVEAERSISSGLKKDTIIVNHDFGHVEGKKFLNKIDLTETKDGIFKVLHRPFLNGVGGSFGSFNYAFEIFRNDYEYWFFNEDDYIMVLDDYMKIIKEQLDSDSNVAYVCVSHKAQRNSKGYIQRTSSHPAHAHGGLGGTHIKFLNKCYNTFGNLPHSNRPMSSEVISLIKQDKKPKFDEGWYSEFEKYGEVAFSNTYKKDFGYELQVMKLPDGKGHSFYSARHQNRQK